MRYLLLSILICLSACLLPAQNPIKVEEMDFSYQIEESTILISLFAPTPGWLAVGFNSVDHIVGADLYMFAVKDDKVIYEDQFVRGIQNHPADDGMGGTDDIEIVQGNETEEGTFIQFRLPLNSSDQNDFALAVDKDLWLILAYSLEDEFDHHSIMRKHIPYFLKE